MKNKLTLTLLLAALLCGMISCGNAEAPAQTAAATSAALTTDAPETTTETVVPLAVPKSDYNGKTFTVLSTQYGEYEYNITEQSGDIVSDAIYSRNLAVEELLNIDLAYYIVPGPADAWESRTAVNKAIKSSVLAGDGAYDLISAVTVATLPTAGEGYFMDANKLEYVNLSNPWWIADQNDNLGVGGKLYGFIGDSSLSLYKDLSVLFFNRVLVENYSLDDPYAYVHDGTWTVDNFMKMVAQSSADLDGNGEMTAEADLYGLMGMAVPQRAYMTSTDINIIARDENGMPYFTALPESAVTVYQKLYSLFMQSANVYSSPTGDHEVYSTYFANDRSLFMNTFLRCSDYLRDMESDFGILPYPKADEAQSDYYTQIGTSTSMLFVPITTNDAVLTSMVCEAMAYYSSRGVVDAYYEVTLKEKYGRDDEVRSMLDIIRAGASMDFVFAYSTCFTEYPNCMTEFKNGDQKGENIASWYEKNLDKWNTTLQKLLASYAEIG